MPSPEAARHPSEPIPTRYSFNVQNPIKQKKHVQSIDAPVTPKEPFEGDIESRGTLNIKVSQIERVLMILLVYGSVFLLDTENFVLPYLQYVIAAYLSLELVLFLGKLIQKRD